MHRLPSPVQRLEMVLVGPSKILPPLLAAGVAAYACFVTVDKVFGGPKPKTFTAEWAAASKAMRDSWPRNDSGAGPVKLDPISRGAEP